MDDPQAVPRRCSCGGELKSCPDFETRVGDRTYRFVGCKACRRRVLDPIPNHASLATHYDQEYYGAGTSKFAGPIESFVESFRRRRANQTLRILQQVPRATLRRPRVLDIGCGSGEFLRSLLDRGVECHGTELSEASARRAARVPGLVLRTGALPRTAYAPEYFDVISIWHVLEHLPDPDTILAHCHRWLVPEGRLMIAVPNADSWQARIFRGAWFHVDPPRHLHHFGPDSLRRTLAATGFEIERTQTLSLEQNLYGVLQSLPNALGFPREHVYEILKRNRPFRLDASTLAQFGLMALTLPAAVVEVLVEALAGCGGTIEAIVRPAEHTDR